MSGFLSACAQHAFLRQALVASVLAAVACGTVGSLIVVRRSTYIAGAISHSVLAGLGFARYAAVVWGWEAFHPTLGALLAAVLSALLVVAICARGHARRDTVLSVVWAVGMAVGIAFMAATPGYQEDLMSYLFGNVLLVSRQDLIVMALLNGLLVALLALGYRGLLAVSFNAELAGIRGVRTLTFETLLGLLTAVAVVLLIQVVGVVLVIALLTLPAATAALFTRRLVPMMLMATLLCAFVTVGGLALSYTPEWPVSSTIVFLAGGLYAVLSWRVGRQARSTVPR